MAFKVSGSIPLISTKTDHKARCFVVLFYPKENKDSDTCTKGPGHAVSMPWAFYAKNKSSTARITEGTVTVSYSLGEKSSVTAPTAAPAKIGRNAVLNGT